MKYIPILRKMIKFYSLNVKTEETNTLYDSHHGTIHAKGGHTDRYYTTSGDLAYAHNFRL